jgi:hypothetical protein
MQAQDDPKLPQVHDQLIMHAERLYRGSPCSSMPNQTQPIGTPGKVGSPTLLTRVE